MARVVRRRKNPLLPVLIIFVILFLITATMAVLFYNEGEDGKKKLKTRQAIGRKIITKDEMDIAQVRQIVSEKEKDRGAPTVVAVLLGRIGTLTDKITGGKTTAKVALDQLNDSIGPNTFVVNAMKISRKATADVSSEVTALKDRIKSLEASKENTVTNYQSLETEFKAKATKLAEEVQTLSAEKTALVSTHVDAMKANDDKWRAKDDKQAQEIDARMAEVSKLKVEIDKLTLRNGILTGLLADKKKTRPRDLAVREAGKIKEVMPNRNVCFVPLGSKDRVVRGMTFRVYGPEGIPSDGGGPKASLTVIRTFETISPCRVTTIDDEDPVAIGDPFANIAYDPTRVPVFVVQGRFDLSGSGRLTEAGTKEVMALIKRSGGKITEKLTVDVDFVVMGPEPNKPAALEEDAPGPAKKAHEIRMEEYNRWQKTLDRAIALNVPKLNTKRFLTLTGYDSVKEYEDD